MGKDADYHKRPEWSYSSMKVILDSGIDYAVALKEGLLEKTYGKAVDVGSLAHMIVLGGDDCYSLSPYSDFRSKEARNWRDEQIENGKTIITQSEFEAVTHIVTNIENHPHSKKYLLGDGWKHEVEMYAKTSNGVDIRGKADAIKVAGDSLTITDIKTTAKFDDFKKRAFWNHYDLQAAVYTMIGSASNKISPSFTNYYFCVAETVEPYRVQFLHASLEFVENGERKLSTCVEEIKNFGDKKPNFLIEEVEEIGDYSL